MTTRSPLTLFALLVGTLPQVAPAGIIRHDVADSEYLALAAEARYSGVGKILINYGSSQTKGCSGTLIDASWVLTAAHCLAYPGVTSVTYKAGGVTYSAASWVYHNAFTVGGTTSYDIGLLNLATAATGVEVATLYTGTDEFGLVGTTVGFGKTGTGLTGAINGTDGTKRAGDNIIEQYINNALLWSDLDSGSSDDNALGTSTQLDLEYLGANGDSGGGVFANIDGTDYLVGLNSFIVDHNSNSLIGDYGDFGAATRVSSYIDWVETTTGLEFAQTGSVPNAPTLALFLAGLFGARQRARDLFS